VAIANRDVLEIEALGPEMATLLASGGYALDLADLFEFALDCQAARAKDVDKYELRLKKSGFSIVGVNKMLEGISQARTRDWDRWLVALNVEGIGKVLGKQLAMALKLDTLGTLCTKLKTIGDFGLEGFGDKKLDNVVRWATENDELCQRLHEAGVRPKAQVSKVVVTVSNGQQPLAGMAICVTGEHLGMDREVIQAHLKALGADIKSGVTKKVTHVVAGMGAGPSKLQKARELGILVLDTKWLKNTLESNGVKIPADGDFDTDVEI
jgi:DNA ligase (NAD+)